MSAGREERRKGYDLILRTRAVSSARSRLSSPFLPSPRLAWARGPARRRAHNTECLRRRFSLTGGPRSLILNPLKAGPGIFRRREAEMR